MCLASKTQQVIATRVSAWKTAGKTGERRRRDTREYRLCEPHSLFDRLTTPLTPAALTCRLCQPFRRNAKHIQYFQQQVASLRQVETNPVNYRLSVSGYLAELDRMNLEVREYLWTHPAEVSDDAILST